MLADNELIAATIDRGVIATRRLGLQPSPIAVSHAMAVSQDHRLLYVLVPRGANQPAGSDRVDVINTTTLQVRASYRLDRAVAYRSLALAPHTGRLFLFGTRSEPSGQRLQVSMLDPASGRQLGSWDAHPASGHTWLPHVAIVAIDERHLVVSYHGSDTTGADVLTLAGGRLVRCAGAPASVGCLQSVHGDVVATAEGHLLATTGDAQRIEELTLDGQVIRRWDSELTGNHLMELGLDPERRWLYAIGSCGYTGGLSAIDLRSGAARLLAPPSGPRDPETLRSLPGICGERIEAGLGGLVVVAKTARAVPQPQASGAVLVVDGQNGRLLRTIATPSEPVDLLLVPGL
jgi:DNA-binding beta-propeller fold protein YncE